jgi:hypothetical protein
MTTAQIIMFPLDRVAISQQPRQHTKVPAHIIMFPGVRQERLNPKHAYPVKVSRGKSKQPISAD